MTHFAKQFFQKQIDSLNFDNSPNSLFYGIESLINPSLGNIISNTIITTKSVKFHELEYTDMSDLLFVRYITDTIPLFKKVYE
jgi:hypothetical protein